MWWSTNGILMGKVVALVRQHMQLQKMMGKVAPEWVYALRGAKALTTNLDTTSESE